MVDIAEIQVTAVWLFGNGDATITPFLPEGFDIQKQFGHRIPMDRREIFVGCEW